jgi:hypothetical protein
VVEPPRSKSEKPEPKSEPQQPAGDAKPAPESMKKMLRARLDSAALTDLELLQHFEYTQSAEKFWADLTLDQGNSALKWIANPS